VCLCRQIRSLLGIGAEEYIESFRGTTKERFSEGRSGAFLYFSQDERYIVKTTTHKVA
jgi:1-phosphatidylinositol-4-phosphate 5-kinase